MPFPVYPRKYESECHPQPITKSAELRDLQGSIGYQGHSCPITLAYGIPRFPTPPFRSISFGWEQVGKTKYPSIIKGIVDHVIQDSIGRIPLRRQASLTRNKSPFRLDRQTAQMAVEVCSR